jgi:hypothetical protein
LRRAGNVDGGVKFFPLESDSSTRSSVHAQDDEAKR